jgi:hypothetical protein
MKTKFIEKIFYIVGSLQKLKNIKDQIYIKIKYILNLKKFQKAINIK